ncbi:MAG: HD-GYP domain-containing protein [Planctomycetaceae bacterium]
MDKRANFRTLIAAQLICTALGFWMHQRFLVSEVQKSVESGLASEVAKEAAANISQCLPTVLGIGAITFVWTNGLLAMIAYMVVARMHHDLSAGQQQSARETLKHSTDLMRTQGAVIFGLAKLAASRDLETGDHLERISLYSSTLASALRRQEAFRETITPTFVHHIGISSALHDIGKVGVEDAILRKTGPLTAQERRAIQDHTRIGEECLREIERRLGSSNFLRMAREIAGAHHERWDGSGYPAGVRGEEIPLAARIVAIADVYDALSTRRTYKQALGHRECVEAIRCESGQHFDPRLVEVFIEIEPQFEDISRRFSQRSELVADRIVGDIDRTLAAITADQADLPREKGAEAWQPTSFEEFANT